MIMTGIHWKKKGMIYSPDKRLPWAKSHAQIPTVDIVDKERLRILFSSRDKHNRSLLASLDVNALNPSEILKIQANPLMNLGSP